MAFPDLDLPATVNTSSYEIMSSTQAREKLKDTSDSELMRHLQHGTVEAFNILVFRYSYRLMRYLYRMCGNLALCEDIIQDTFMSVFRNRHSYKNKGSNFANWIYTIAGNMIRAHHRKQERRQTHSADFLAHPKPTNVEFPDTSVPPEWHLEMDTTGQIVQHALKTLRAEYREVVVLRDIQQLSYKEISDIAHIPLGTVKSRVHRGRAEIRSLLQDVNPYRFKSHERLGLPWAWLDQIHGRAASQAESIRDRRQKEFADSTIDQIIEEAPIWTDHDRKVHDMYDMEEGYRSHLWPNHDESSTEAEAYSGSPKTVEIKSEDQESSLSDSTKEQHIQTNTSDSVINKIIDDLIV